MAFREWIKTEIEAPLLTEERGKRGAEVAWATLLQVKDEIIRGGRWRYSPEVENVEAEIGEAYRAVVDGSGFLEAFSEACKKWKRIGTREPAQIEKGMSPIFNTEGEHHGSA